MDRKKLKYKLWREYLKRSDTYKKVCEWLREFQKDSKTSRPKELTNKMDGIFVMFGDVHKEPFNKWWESRKKIFRCLEYEGINDYSKFIEEDIESCIFDFRFKKGKEPTLQEFKEHFSARMRNDKDIVYLCIAVGGRQKKELVTQFNKIITGIINKRRQDPYEINYRRNLTTVLGAKSKDDYMMEDELKRYLKAYDLKKKNVKLLSIADKLKICTGGGNGTRQREVLRDIQKAKQIIKNAEEGLFPYKY